MIDLLTAARYISQRYEQTFNTPIEEMKLHRLLYFVQRESLLLFDKPVFTDQFEAWEWGPVMSSLRGVSLDMSVDVVASCPALEEYLLAFDRVFTLYAPKNPWSLSSLTYGETCYRKAKAKMTDDKPMEIVTDDIRHDAQRINFRRILYGCPVPPSPRGIDKKWLETYAIAEL